MTHLCTITSQGDGEVRHSGRHLNLSPAFGIISGPGKCIEFRIAFSVEKVNQPNQPIANILKTFLL